MSDQQQPLLTESDLATIIDSNQFLIEEYKLDS